MSITTILKRRGCLTVPRLTLMSLIKMMLVMVSVAAISKTFGLLRFLLRLSFLAKCLSNRYKLITNVRSSLMAVNIHITIIELNALHTKRQNLFQELDAVIHLLMEAKHWGLRKSRNATSLNSRFKSLDTLEVKIISVTFRRVIRTNHKKASKIWRHENIQLGGCQSSRLFPRQIRANTISFTVFPEIVPSIGNSFINTMKNINHTRSSISDDIRNILCSSANMRRAIPLILRLLMN